MCTSKMLQMTSVSIVQKTIIKNNIQRQRNNQELYFCLPNDKNRPLTLIFDKFIFTNGRSFEITLDFHTVERPFKLKCLFTFWPSFESIFVEILNDKTKNIIVGVIYRPPKSNINDFIEKFELSIEKINKEKKECYFMGNYNLDLLKSESNNLINSFLDSLYYSSLTPLISKPTRITTHSASLIDNIFSNVLENNQPISGIIYSDISDHLQ